MYACECVQLCFAVVHRHLQQTCGSIFRPWAPGHEGTLSVRSPQLPAPATQCSTRTQLTAAEAGNQAVACIGQVPRSSTACCCRGSHGAGTYSPFGVSASAPESFGSRCIHSRSTEGSTRFCACRLQSSGFAVLAVSAAPDPSCRSAHHARHEFMASGTLNR